MKDPEFWHAKWASNQIGFHLTDVNTLLTDHWHTTQPKREDRVFVPLCGKSEDLVWLAEKHNDVQGVELSPIAVRAFFAEHFYTPTVTQISSCMSCISLMSCQFTPGIILLRHCRPLILCTIVRH